MWELRFRRDGWSVEEGFVKGREPPDWYLDEPESRRGDDLFMRAYWTLDSERPAGFGVSRIPWSRTIQYGERLGLERDVCDLLWSVVTTMDEGYIKFVTERSEEEGRRARRAARRSGSKAKTGGTRSRRNYKR